MDDRSLGNSGVNHNMVPASAPTSPLHQSKSHIGLFSYGNLFRTVKSCANLEAMNTQVPPQEPKLPQPMDQSTGNLMTRSLFRSVRSCINLEGMEKTPAKVQPVISENEERSSSGILFSSYKGFKAKSSMVSERDINLIAPMSS